MLLMSPFHLVLAFHHITDTLRPTETARLPHVAMCHGRELVATLECALVAQRVSLSSALESGVTLRAALRSALEVLVANKVLSADCGVSTLPSGSSIG